jgi:hypothetical protein
MNQILNGYIRILRIFIFIKQLCAETEEIAKDANSIPEVLKDA